MMAWTDSITNVLIIVIGSFVGLGGIAGLIFWLARRRGKGNAHLFMLYSRNDLSRPTVIKGYITGQENNKAQKEFYFPDFKQNLSIRKPSFYFNGVAYRQIISNDRGEFDYIDDAKLNEKNQLIQVLTPEEKQILVNRYRMNAERYQNPMNKWSVLGLLGSMLFAFLIVAAVGYTAYAQGSAAKVHAEASKETGDATRALERTALKLEETTALLVQVSAQIRGEDGNLTRVIS